MFSFLFVFFFSSLLASQSMGRTGSCCSIEPGEGSSFRDGDSGLRIHHIGALEVGGSPSRRRPAGRTPSAQCIDTHPRAGVQVPQHKKSLGSV
ncbi:hypothetical protein GGS23DRAFT_566248 [Durotheca rogersii]|uniref:uncharacterized protein n=1 Tax=Durotheca rogersii TaxID=419775 RepID=UPI00222024CE|nr:uncharacterized protein GGS23DRAFT_566248 [Durotheca rogersii]KAI5863297.1 hypothetical protein GGS23DRAFT_566248 [Durotheca rogersii]